MSINSKIGFIQGRLSEIVDGKIQAFPWQHWREEFESAASIGINLMEWTLDQEKLYENPYMTSEGQLEIQKLSKNHNVTVYSLTGDCFMQAPFYKETGSARKALLDDFKNIIQASAKLGVKYIVFPLVDNGRLENHQQEDDLISGLQEIEPLLENKIKIVFESDFPPEKLKSFIDRLAAENFGINYDIGNSAALGYNPKNEITVYGERILNVHIKDRVLGGTTVPLGTGNADFSTVFSALKETGYRGNYILQTARATDDNHSGVLKQYRDQVSAWINAG